jgi:uncharacterized membrane protein YsdA (DUF1294 family)
MEQTIIRVITGYLILMTAASFLLMGIDKKRAVRKAWRIPERTLLLAAFLGGGIGAFLGMYTFRHKTKHMKFVILLPAAAVLYLLLLLKLYHII